MALCRGQRFLVPLAVLLLSLSACTIGPDTGPDPEVDAAPYPALSTVPPRPKLTYSIDQRREIANALVSDRANARYDRAVARYEVGLDDTPPPAARPAVVAEPEPPVGGVDVVPVVPPEPLPPGGGAIAELEVRQQVLTERNNGRLASFLNILERQLTLNQKAEEAGVGVLPDPVQPDTLPGKPPVLPVAAEPIAKVQPAPSPEPAAGPESPEAALSLTFQPRSADLPADAEPALRTAAQAAQAENRRLVVEGQGSSPTLGLDRARSVASWLMRLGAPPDMVTFRGGGAGEDVIVRLLPSDAA